MATEVTSDSTAEMSTIVTGWLSITTTVSSGSTV
jgi:hypothetical protein